LTLIATARAYNNFKSLLCGKEWMREGVLDMNQKRSVILNVLALLAVFALAGCYEPTAYPEFVTTPLAPTLPKPATFLIPGQYSLVGTSVQRLPILSFVLGQGPDVAFVLATIHGNETVGTPLVRRLGKYLQQNPHLMTGRQQAVRYYCAI